MVLLYLVLLLGTCAISFSSDASFKSNYQKAPRYTINLDLPPQKRWESVLKNFDKTIVKQVANTIIAQLSGYKYELIQRLSKKYIDHLIHPYISEMQGIAKIFNGSFADVVMLNIYFDSYLRGTSIIAKDPKGDILHGRNLDVPFTSWLRKMAIVVDYKRKGKYVSSLQADLNALFNWPVMLQIRFNVDKCKVMHLEAKKMHAAYIPGGVQLWESMVKKDLRVLVDQRLINIRSPCFSNQCKQDDKLVPPGFVFKIVYTGTTFVGYVGLWTGQKPNKFTISANSRDHGDWFDHGLYFCEDSYPDGWLIRDVLEKADHFLTAYLKLMSSPVLQSIYITMAGIKQGVIIVREKATSLDSYYFEPDKWFLLQTDCDINQNKCQKDTGRVAIVNDMNKGKKKNINMDNLFKVLASINGTDINTAYTTIMRASSPGIYATWIRK